jgi:hypothetical protein
MLKKFTYLLLPTFLLIACKTDRLNIDVEPLDLNLEVSRLDLDLANARNRAEMKKVHEFYAANHEEFYNFYLGACLQIGLIEDTFTLQALEDFTQDTYIQDLHLEMKQRFSDVKEELNAFKMAISYLHHYFPEAALPQNIIFYNSLFTNSVVSSENTVGVGLERYLGEQSKSIQELPEDPFYPYIKKRMDRQFLVRDLVMSWIGSNVLPEIQDDKELADVMIQWGKHFYVLEACLPKAKKAVVLRYFPEEYEWAETNEKEFWNYLVAQNSLFKRDFKMALNIFSDGPFTSGLPIDSQAPPRLGQFLGWRIVKNYMNKNKNTSLAEMIELDFRTIIKSYN